MPKIYWKTIIASAILGATLVALLQRVLTPRLGSWIILVLTTFIIINEKLTVREKWKTQHILLFISLAALYTVMILLL